MSKIDNLWQKFKGNGKVYNYTRKWIWVVEATTNHPTGPAIAHKLAPRTKAPIKFDIDGFKRVDGKAIEGHSTWWKIWGHCTADLYDHGNGVRVDVVVKFKVSENKFGSVVYDDATDWGDPIRHITRVEKGRNGRIARFFVDDYGWISRKRAIELVAKAKIDNAVLVQPKNGEPYLRALPDRETGDNFSSMVT